jgi:hypothetical protein
MADFDLKVYEHAFELITIKDYLTEYDFSIIKQFYIAERNMITFIELNNKLTSTPSFNKKTGPANSAVGNQLQR